MIIYRYDDYGLEYDFFFSVLPSSSAGTVTARMSPLSKSFCLAHSPWTANHQRCQSLRVVGY